MHQGPLFIAARQTRPHRKQSVRSSKTSDPSKNRAKPKHACSRQNSESRSSPRWIAKAINKSPVVGRWPRFHREIELEFASGCQMFVPHRSEEHTSELQSLRHLVCRL